MPNFWAAFSGCGELSRAMRNPIRGLKNTEMKKNDAPLGPFSLA
jgi:hypothetical protein